MVSPMPHDESQGAADSFGNLDLSRPVAMFIVALAIGIAYVLAARLGLIFLAKPGLAVFWPAAGIAVGALIVLGRSARWPVSAAVVVGTVLANMMIGRQASLAAIFGLINVVQALLTAWLIERWFGRMFKLEDVFQVLGFLLASTLGSAVGAAGSAIAIGFVQATTPSLGVWRIWFASCLLGIVTVAPLLIGLGAAAREQLQLRELMEGTLAQVTIAALCVFLLQLSQPPWATVLLIALVFVLLWVAVRCRPVFAAATTFVVALAVFTATTLNVGYFGDASIPLSDRILAAQILVLVGALLAFVLAALFAERRQHEAMLKRSKERLQLVVAELDHRVKNVFATVSAVATHTLGASNSMDHFVAALDGRLRSMASTHELLSDRRWRGVTLSDLACRELAPYKLMSNSEVSGPEVMLSAEAGQALAMVLHELVTNAAKHGALSTREGRVSVRWHWPLNGSTPDRLILEWVETGGPSVKTPSRSGYGTSVIGDLIPYELGGKVDLAFACDGLRCRMEIPADWVSRDASANANAQERYGAQSTSIN
jgi:two-component sensor histidine kinase/integral membrane sensor domain MASE1